MKILPEGQMGKRYAGGPGSVPESSTRLLTNYAPRISQEICMWFATAPLAMDYVRKFSPLPTKTGVIFGEALLYGCLWDAIIVHRAGMPSNKSLRLNKYLGSLSHQVSARGRVFYV